MSTQIEIGKQLVNYLLSVGYRQDPIIDTLVKETKDLGEVAIMQIAPEQGQLLEIIVKISKTKPRWLVTKGGMPTLICCCFYFIVFLWSDSNFHRKFSS